MTLVTFKHDVFPYCKGDTVDLSEDEQTRVDTVAEHRDIDAYTVGSSTGDDDETRNDGPKPLTKKELFAIVEEEHLTLPEGITDKSKVADIQAAVDDARKA